MGEASQHFNEEMTSNQRNDLQGLFCQAISAVTEKWKNTPAVRDSQALVFLKKIQFFDPTRLATFESDVANLISLPGLPCVPEPELNRYRESIGPQAVKASSGTPCRSHCQQVS
ncbi:hypothetical protein RRG08_052654 [Elysia crispata]|uniref:Uncharacterized protein n=1 Tax=Elysia crispata TaxID=231223 RepID=A0AAE0ZWW1_9GAST|nr:hypothetical protein RRG08_052654 [Elysia crispata]